MTHCSDKGVTYAVTVRTARGIMWLKGREAWALQHLILAGERGLTTLERPAPRWSAYVFKLRKLGFEVETIHEQHGGAYAGRHARYILRTPCEILRGQPADAD